MRRKIVTIVTIILMSLLMVGYGVVRKFGEKRKRKQKAERLSDYYRKEVMSEKILENLSQEEFGNFILVANRADFGVWTAIEAAFCLGYGKGKGDVSNA